MKIIKLETRPMCKQKVFLDNGESFVMLTRILKKMNLKLNSNISPEQYDYIVNDVLYKDACSKELKAIGMRAHSVWELEENIKKYPEQTRKKTMKFLASYNYADDNIFARNFIYDCLTLKYYGKMRISFELHNKKVDEQIIKDALEKYIDDEKEYESAKKFIELNFLKPNQRSETKLRNKLYRHGYSFNVIDRAVKDLAAYSDEK